MKDNIALVNFDVLIPYISLNSGGKVWNAVKAINGQIGFMCFGTGPPAIISLTSIATSVIFKKCFSN